MDQLKEKKILVTGSAGFIGFHLSKKLGREGARVTGLDNLNDYYDVSLKKARLKILQEDPNFRFEKIDLREKEKIDSLFEDQNFDFIVHLAAQAGVRYSLKNPYAYIDSNIVGFLNILEACRNSSVKHLIYASSSSVYGGNTKLPFSVHDKVDHPVSLYAATKRSNELMAHTYAHLFNLPVTGLRFFTVYGPWGRPDMALFLFTNSILKGEPIDVYNFGNMRRDFTYIDDIIEGIYRLIPIIPERNENWKSGSSDSFSPYKLYNIGNNNPVELERFISVLEECLDKKATRNLLPIQDGDVPETYADIKDLQEITGFTPSTSIEEGIPKFVEWYLDYNQNSTKPMKK